MGQYKFWMAVCRGFGFSFVWYKKDSIDFQFLFIRFAIGLTEHAHGYALFDKWFSE